MRAPTSARSGRTRGATSAATGERSASGTRRGTASRSGSARRGTGSPSGSARAGSGSRNGSARRSPGWSRRSASSSAWVLTLVCVAWDWLRCAIVAIVELLRRALRRPGSRATAQGRSRLRPHAREPFVRPHVRVQRAHRRRDRRSANDGGRGRADRHECRSDDDTAGGRQPARRLRAQERRQGPAPRVQGRPRRADRRAASSTRPSAYPPIDNSGFVAHYLAKGGASARASDERASDRSSFRCSTPSPASSPSATPGSRRCPGRPGRTGSSRMAASSGALDDSPSTADVILSETLERLPIRERHDLRQARRPMHRVERRRG